MPAPAAAPGAPPLGDPRQPEDEDEIPPDLKRWGRKRALLGMAFVAVLFLLNLWSGFRFLAWMCIFVFWNWAELLLMSL